MRRLLLALTICAAALALAAVPPAHAWTWPADGPVLQPFVFDPSHPYAGGQHRGIDVGGAVGSVVRAPAGGAVTFAGSVPTSGKALTIQTADGWSVTLTHLGSIAVTKGATVAEGDGVGTIGPSGEPEVSEPYVHLGSPSGNVCSPTVEAALPRCQIWLQIWHRFVTKSRGRGRFGTCLSAERRPPPPRAAAFRPRPDRPRPSRPRPRGTRPRRRRPRSRP